MIHKSLVVNLFGEPGCGKSTGAAYIFSLLKMRGINTELVTEFAKDLIWDGSKSLRDQSYVYGCQHNRLVRCADQVDVIVTDSPLPLSILYTRYDPDADPYEESCFHHQVMNDYYHFKNLNYVLERQGEYSMVGREQTEAEAEEIRKDMIRLLNSNDIHYTTIQSDRNGYMAVIDDVCSIISNTSWEKQFEDPDEPYWMQFLY